MADWKEWRQPWYLLLSKSKHQEIILPLKKSGKLIYFEPHEYDQHYYTLQQIDSDLLIAIDNDDVASVEKALKKDKINVNTPYMIPPWEVPDSYPPQLQTFLHRAIWERSAAVFKFLLEKGANPRTGGHCLDTVVDNVFNEHHLSPNELLKFGTILIDFGIINAKEIAEQPVSRNPDYKDVITKLKHGAYSKAKLIQRQRNKRMPENLDYIRES